MDKEESKALIIYMWRLKGQFTVARRPSEVLYTSVPPVLLWWPSTSKPIAGPSNYRNGPNGANGRPLAALVHNGRPLGLEDSKHKTSKF